LSRQNSFIVIEVAIVFW